MPRAMQTELIALPGEAVSARAYVDGHPEWVEGEVMGVRTYWVSDGSSYTLYEVLLKGENETRTVGSEGIILLSEIREKEKESLGETDTRHGDED